MKLIAQTSVVVLVLNLLAPISGVAQQPSGGNMGELREQIAKLEKIDADLETSPEVKDINRNFLSERRAELKALLRKRISALRQYLSEAGGALKSEERQGVEKSIRTLTEELGDGGAVEARGPALTLTAAANIPAGTDFLVQVNQRKPAAATGSLSSFSAFVPEPRGYALSTGVLPNPVPQDVIQLGASAGDPKLTINTSPTPEIPKPLEVRNEALVTITGTKSLINTCAVASKREELKPEPNPLAQMLKLIFSLGPIGIAKVAPTCAPPVNRPNTPEVKQIDAELEALKRILDRTMDTSMADSVEYERLRYEEMANRIAEFTRCKGVKVSEDKLVQDQDTKELVFEPICGDQSLFGSAKARLITDVEALLKLELPSTDRELPVIESAELQLTTIKKLLTNGYTRTGDATEEAWIDSVNTRLDCSARRLEILRKSRAFILSAHAEFQTARDLLTAHKTSFTYAKALIADSNAKVTGTVTCSNFFTKQVAFDPIPFTVTYQDTPRGAVSLGVLYTTLDKRQIGIQPVRVGTAADGTSTFRLTFTETDRAAGQLVPFTFYNYRVWGDRRFSLNGSGGVGVNPNNGSTQVEFFFGGSLGYRNFFLQLGGHVGRWQELGGGFTIGDTVAASPPAVPIERRYSVRPAIGVSYKIPLP